MHCEILFCVGGYIHMRTENTVSVVNANFFDQKLI